MATTATKITDMIILRGRMEVRYTSETRPPQKLKKFMQNEAWERTIDLLEAANKQCNGVSEETEPAVKLAAAQTCGEAFTELDRMALNCCIGWVEAKCRRVQGSTDARYQCTVKMPLCPLQDLLQVPKTLRDCAYTTLAEAWTRRTRSRRSRSSTAGSSSSGQQVQQSSGSGRKRQRQNTDGASGSGSAGASGSRSARPPSPPRFVHRPLSPTPENPPIPGSGSAGPSGSRPARTPSFSFLDDLLPPTPEDSVSIPHDNTLISDPSYSVDAFLSEDPSRFGGLPYSVVDPFSRPTSPPRYSPVSPSDLFRGSFSLPSTPEHLGAPADPPPGHVLDEGFGVDDFSDDDALLYLEGGPAEQVAEDSTGATGNEGLTDRKSIGECSIDRKRGLNATKVNKTSADRK
ncbi:unnamed protein product [Bemisia tabaci]|uniref:Uncharacterized protein n=1 Tax=Bemisia tabaci TaxID=7038 RepID=A0A9P0AIC0_BEMTA|nr:unnamed protein product [Bemisia tabaci]